MILRWPREFLEKDACFVGFMLFRNEIKKDTPKALSLLREGGCNLAMLTGDNVDTALYIGWTSGMIRKGGPRQAPVVVVGDIIDKELRWRNLDDDTDIGESVLSVLIQRSRKGFRPIEIAITGKAFKLLSMNGWLQNNLLEVRIFAGMKPDDKVKCVRLFMEKGITAMCGDGGNDAGALKTAHSGIALTPDNNSSVVGHFSSTDTSIMTCVELLKEGRCALDVSFASYRYLMLYGEITGFIGMIQYFYKTSVSQALYIFIDITTIPLSWGLSSARPAKKLANTRPTAKLLGYETVSSVLGQLIIDMVFMAIGISGLFQQSFYKCHAFAPLSVDMSHWWELADNYEAALISIFIIFQIFNAAAAINIGSRYRRGSLKNWTFVLIFVACVSIISFVILADPNPLGCLFRINCGTKESLLALGYTVNFEAPAVYHSEFGHNVFPRPFRNWILGMCILNLFVLLVWEGLVIQGPVRRWAARKWK
jgi:cation-transporting ATPase 13A3/4/5